MHVLTKIFVVLVCLMAILLTPLVVVYSHNEESYRARYQGAQSQAQVARDALSAAEQRFGADRTRLMAEVDNLNDEIARLRAEADKTAASNRKLESELTAAGAFQNDLRGNLQTLSEAVSASQKLTENLIDEVRDTRRDALTAEQRRAELDERLRDVSGKLEVADEARRALQEELQRMNDENASALQTISQYVAIYGSLDDTEMPGLRGVVATHDIRTVVLNVITTADEKLAEINAGSRDGVQEGNVFLVSSDGQFIANLRIIDVDINRATGRVELEDAQGRGEIQAGQDATVRKGS